MDTYYGVIYFKDGSKKEVGNFSGPGAEQTCERQTQQLFERYLAIAAHPRFEPSRFQVLKR
jgi:hypothetical protein